MAIDVGVRPDICTIDVPSSIREVSRPHQASGVNASRPPGLGGEDRVEAGLLGRGDELAHALRRLRLPVTQLQSELHVGLLTSRVACRIVERVLVSDHDTNTVSTGHRSVRLHPLDRARCSDASSPACATAEVVGGRTSEGRVVVPPPEFDPVTHEAIDEFVEVAPTGTVTSWTWVPEPVKDQPFDRPFAFALVTLDGADTPLLHALDVSSPDEVSTGHAGAGALGRGAGGGDHRHRVL